MKISISNKYFLFIKES